MDRLISGSASLSCRARFREHFRVAWGRIVRLESSLNVTRPHHCRTEKFSISRMLRGTGLYTYYIAHVLYNTYYISCIQTRYHITLML